MRRDVAIISTSIHARPEAYESWARQGQLIVAGDRKTPPDLPAYINELGGVYLDVTDQEADADSETWSALVGWNCIQRRNAALAYALRGGYDFVATVDDDNHPPDEWVDAHVRNLTDGPPSSVETPVPRNGWVNVGAFTHPPTLMRGTPHSAARLTYATQPRDPSIPVVVSTSPVLGDPDVGASSRIIDDVQVSTVHRDVVVPPTVWGTFNSQATMWHGAWAPLLAVLPGVGRYDDIFASVIAQRIMRAHRVGWVVSRPPVVQSRNAHDNARDLRDEVFGMETMRLVVDALDNPELRLSHNPISAYRTIADALGHILPKVTTRFMHAWADLWSVIDSRREEPLHV